MKQLICIPLFIFGSIFVYWAAVDFDKPHWWVNIMGAFALYWQALDYLKKE